MEININEIFQSIDGEVNRWGQGRQTVFVRLQGCNLRCDFCDTKKTWESNKGTKWDTKVLVDYIFGRFECRNLTITGGEPLQQEPEVTDFLIELFKINPDYIGNTSLETNGTLLISPYLKDLLGCIVMDFKPSYIPNPINYLSLRSYDWVKFIITDKKSFGDANIFLANLRNQGLKANVAFSPVTVGCVNKNVLQPNELLQWLRHADLWDVHLNVQIHKLIDVY